LPVLDIAGFIHDPTSAAGTRFVDDLREICHEVGFLYVAGHGVPDDLNAAIERQARQFFALPLAQRLSIENVNSPQFRGYTRLGGEYTAGRADRREQIDIGPEDPVQVIAAGDPAWLRLRGPNLWPATLPEFRSTVQQWLVELQRLGNALLRALALALGQASDRFDAIVHPCPDFRLKIIRYPVAETESERQGLGPHRDAGFLSIILQDDVGGLQVQRGMSFVDVPKVPGAFVVNLGEMLQLVTHGYFAATIHRVVSPPIGADRISVSYFHNPALHATLLPVDLPPVLAAAAPGGASIDLSNPILANFGENTLKVRMRSHPDVARRHHADLLHGLVIGSGGDGA
jgi:isopenicillin N synthase-like dioxygenase